MEVFIHATNNGYVQIYPSFNEIGYRYSHDIRWLEDGRDIFSFQLKDDGKYYSLHLGLKDGLRNSGQGTLCITVFCKNEEQIKGLLITSILQDIAVYLSQRYLSPNSENPEKKWKLEERLWECIDDFKDFLDEKTADLKRGVVITGNEHQISSKGDANGYVYCEIDDVGAYYDNWKKREFITHSVVYFIVGGILNNASVLDSFQNLTGILLPKPTSWLLEKPSIRQGGLEFFFLKNGVKLTVDTFIEENDLIGIKVTNGRFYEDYIVDNSSLINLESKGLIIFENSERKIFFNEKVLSEIDFKPRSVKVEIKVEFPDGKECTGAKIFEHKYGEKALLESPFRELIGNEINGHRQFSAEYDGYVSKVKKYVFEEGGKTVVKLKLEKVNDIPTSLIEDDKINWPKYFGFGGLITIVAALILFFFNNAREPLKCSEDYLRSKRDSLEKLGFVVATSVVGTNAEIEDRDTIKCPNAMYEYVKLQKKQPEGSEPEDTIKPEPTPKPSTCSEKREFCDSYRWEKDGKTYDKAGTYTCNFNGQSCTLVLTKKCSCSNEEFMKIVTSVDNDVDKSLQFKFKTTTEAYKNLCPDAKLLCKGIHKWPKKKDRQNWKYISDIKFNQ